MQEPAAKLESKESNVDSAFESADESPHLVRPETVSRNRSMNFTNQGKFTYRSGSIPLPGYTIKRGIGAGGFGEVYFALSDAGKEVALKRIQRNLDVELRGVRQCLNLKHLNLISLWDIRTNEAGESWVVMEYVPGPSLRDLIEAHPGGIPQQQVQVWFSSTAAGVSYLHDQGIVHRDLKPANIFFDEDQQVIKIGDYGLSKFISCSRRSGQTEAVGTFHYMAPEIGKGIYGKEIDIYALGILLFEMLTGDVPFNGESTQEIIMKHLTADPNLDLLPSEFRHALGRSMKKDPQHRFSNVAELLAALPWSATTDPPFVTNANPDGKPKRNLSGMLIDEVDIALVQEGIAFGPLHDTTPEPKKEMIEFIETRQVANHDSVTVAGKPEPIAQAVKGGFSTISNWWYTAPLSTPLKVFILLLVGVVIIANSSWLLPMALTLGLVYLAYYGIRSFTFDTPSHPTQQTMTSARFTTKREAEKNGRFYFRRYLAKQSIGERLTDLIGSMLVAAIACVIFTLLGTNLAGSLSGISVDLKIFAVYAWLSVTTIAGCWGLLIASKCWEHREGDPWLRRLTMCGIGLLTGLVSFFIALLLNVNSTNPMVAIGETSTGTQLAMGNIPALLNHLLIFTLLFGIVRWWKQADPVRKTRLSVWSVGTCLIWAVALSYLLGLDPFWFCIMAMVISASTQLAAPWLHPTVRHKIALSSLNETRAV